MAITFPLADVQRGGLLAATDPGTHMPSFLRRPTEAWHVDEGRYVSGDVAHSFVYATRLAFANHLPLHIRPDDVWFCIAQGFAAHVRENAEALRSRLVSFEGKERLEVWGTEIHLGRPSPWPEAFEGFSAALGGQVGKLRDLVCADFSTTGPVERVAYVTALMDTFQSYFTYQLGTLCGIPEIILDGTPDDWRALLTRARHLSEYDLEWWTDALVPVLERIVATAEGRVDREFWSSIYRRRSTSGIRGVTGWILTLFPYVEYVGVKRNPFLDCWEEGVHGEWPRTDQVRLDLSCFPMSQSSAPVAFKDLTTGEVADLCLVGGMYGVHQDEATLALRPAWGWGVVHDEPPTEARSRSRDS